MTVIDAGPVVRLRNGSNRSYDGAISAARTCYSPRVIDPDEITERQRNDIGPLTFDGGHHTVFQHATFEFALSGISRQLVWSFLHSFSRRTFRPRCKEKRALSTRVRLSAVGAPTRNCLPV